MYLVCFFLPLWYSNLTCSYSLGFSKHISSKLYSTLAIHSGGLKLLLVHCRVHPQWVLSGWATTRMGLSMTATPVKLEEDKQLTFCSSPDHFALYHLFKYSCCSHPDQLFLCWYRVMLLDPATWPDHQQTFALSEDLSLWLLLTEINVNRQSTTLLHLKYILWTEILIAICIQCSGKAPPRPRSNIWIRSFNTGIALSNIPKEQYFQVTVV